MCLSLLHLGIYTHTHLMALCPGLPGWAGTREERPIWILLKQQTVSGSGISWAICNCAPRSRQITMPAHHHSVFLQAGYPSCHPINSVKALKESCCILGYMRRKISFSGDWCFCTGLHTHSGMLLWDWIRLSVWIGLYICFLYCNLFA